MYHKVVKHLKFTILELLVVIAIIVILASLLLPALGTAKATGMRCSCMSNMKQLSFAFGSYGYDYEGWYPAPYDSGISKNWSYKVSEYAGISPNKTYYPITKCGAWPVFYQSPAYVSYQVHDFWSIPLGGRYFNTAGRYTMPWRGLNFSIKYPSTLPLLTEGEEGTAGSGMCYVQNCYTGIQKRHQSGANFIFYDGHGEFWQSAKITAANLHYFNLQ